MQDLLATSHACVASLRQSLARAVSDLEALHSAKESMRLQLTEQVGPCSIYILFSVLGTALASSKESMWLQLTEQVGFTP